MAEFKVTLKSPEGKLTEIKISAKNLADARRIATRRGVVVRVSRDLFSGWAGEKLSLSDRFILLQRLATMVESKVGVSESLRIIHHSYSGVIGRVAGKLYNEIEHGRDLVDAMDSVGRAAFPESVVSVIRTGSKGGDLPSALKKASEMERELDQIKRHGSIRIWFAMLGFIIGVAVLIGSIFWLTPLILGSQLIEMAGDAVEIDGVLKLGTWTSYLAVVLGVVGLIFLAIQTIRPLMPEFVDRVIVHVPFYRDLLTAKRNFTSFYALSVLIGSGIRIEEALRLSYASAPRGAVKQDLGRAVKAVSEGQHWASTMQTLHPTDRASLVMAQDRTQIAKTMSAIAEQYRLLYRNRIERLAPALELIAAGFLIVACVVLFTVTFMPVMQVMNSVLQG